MQLETCLHVKHPVFTFGVLLIVRLRATKLPVIVEVMSGNVAQLLARNKWQKANHESTSRRIEELNRKSRRDILRLVLHQICCRSNCAAAARGIAQVGIKKKEVSREFNEMGSDFTLQHYLICPQADDKSSENLRRLEMIG